MHWKKLSLIAVLSAALVAPAALAQSRGGHRGGGRPGAGAGSQVTAGNPGAGSFGRSGGRNWGGGRGNRGHWHGGHRHGRGGFYPRFYTSYSPFGYPYGYPYGYGYPFGGASAALYYNGYHPVYTARNARAGSLVTDVQQQLAQAGYYRGAIDGIIGAGTRSAIRGYERAHGLRVDGRIDEQLLRSMRLR